MNRESLRLVKQPNRATLQHWFTMSVILVLLIMLSMEGYVFGDSSFLNMTPQNERVACLGDSFVQGIGAQQDSSYPAHLARIINRSVDNYGITGHTTTDVIPRCQLFNETRYGVIILTIGTNDLIRDPFFGGLSPEQFESNLREIFRLLKDTGAIVVYTGVIGDLNYTAICQDEEVYYLPRVLENMIEPNVTSYESGGGDTRLLSSDNFHPNGEGYGVMAERIAVFLEQNGIVDWARTQAQELPEFFIAADSLMNQAEVKVKDISGMDELYAMAEFLRDEGYLEMARWELEENIIEVLTLILDNWDQVIMMFTEADATIKNLEENGYTREALIARGEYSKAEKEWDNLNYEGTNTFLQKIIDRAATIPESTHSAFLGLILLSKLLWRRSRY